MTGRGTPRKEPDPAQAAPMCRSQPTTHRGTAASTSVRGSAALPSTDSAGAPGSNGSDGNRDAVIAEDQHLLVRLARADGMGLGGALDRLGHEMVVGRQIADRIRIGRIAGEEVGLAAAPAEIAGLLRAAPARLLHPAIAAKVIESL